MSDTGNHTRKVLDSIRLEELNLPVKESPVMAYNKAPMRIVGKTLLVGYLADDRDCDNPLESCDGLGMIYDSHRLSKHHQEMQEALALTSSWEPNLDLVDEHPGRFRRAWVEAAKDDEEFREWARETAGPSARLDDAYFERRAIRLWRETESFCSEDSIYDFSFTDDVKHAVWESLRDAGLIGDRDAVPLDVYEHGGQVWSLAGNGMQCPWDTTRGAGVWVPDDCARDEITRRSEVYAFGVVRESGWGEKERFYAELDERYGAGKSPHFKEWHEAFDWLDKTSAHLRAPGARVEKEQALSRGRHRAAHEIAMSALDEYNAWLRGATYGTVLATFQNIGADDDPDWEFVDSEECWGFIGDSYAMEEIAARVTWEADRLEKQAA